jgi:membrane protease YdiL (CAAX protease family)
MGIDVMDDLPAPGEQSEAPPAGEAAPAEQDPPEERRVRGIEFLVFLFLIVPSMLLSFFITRQRELGFPLVATGTILRDLALVALVLFFIWRNRERLASIGVTLKNGWEDVLLGIGLFIPVFFSAGVLQFALKSLGFSSAAMKLPKFLTPHGPFEYALALALVAVVAVAEETIFRGYIINRLGLFSRSPIFVVLASAAIFSLGHGYEGFSGVLIVGWLGVVFALVYLWRRSLVAPVVMHFLQDFVGIILVPLLHFK